MKGCDDSFNSWIPLRYTRKGLKTFDVKKKKIQHGKIISTERNVRDIWRAAGLGTNTLKTSRACEGSQGSFISSFLATTCTMQRASERSLLIFYSALIVP